MPQESCELDEASVVTDVNGSSPTLTLGKSSLLLVSHSPILVEDIQGTQKQQMAIGNQIGTACASATLADQRTRASVPFRCRTECYPAIPDLLGPPNIW